MVDFRNKTFNVTMQDESRDERTMILYTISCNLTDGSEAGKLYFIHFENVPLTQIPNETVRSLELDRIEKIIMLKKLEIQPGMNGVVLDLYREFGNIYSEKFNGWPVSLVFKNMQDEKIYQEAISLGYVPMEAYDNTYIERLKSIYTSLNFNSKQNVYHLLTKLSAPKVRESDISYDVNESTTRDINNKVQNVVTINITYQNEQIGYLMFSVDEENKTIYVENIEVWEVYQNLGFAQYLFKKFGELYMSKYSGWIVEGEFQHPAAESAFKKAIELGWVPAEALNENHFKRNY